ncbi:MAG: hypothetical protein P8N76_05955 [Pirellulaceae bacterium]|nr:hypothetical protein [Pirellulaceae bacterium]
MNCEQFDRQLNRLLDERCRPEQDPTLKKHADKCPDCGSLLETQQLLFGQLKLRSDVIQPAQESTTGIPSWGITGIAAALLLLAVFIPQLIKQASTAAVPPVQAERHTTHSPTLRPADQRVVSSRTTSSNLVSEIMKVRQYLPDEPRMRELQWLEGVSGGIQPLTNSMSSTLNVLRQTWPGSSRPQASSEPQASNMSRSGLLG